LQEKLSFQKATTMRKLLLLPIILLTTIQLQAQDNLPLPENIDAALDSILQEGYTLYLYEKIAWVSTDEFIERIENKSGVRQVVFPSSENELSALFFRESDSTAVFSFKMDLEARAATMEAEPRPLTDLEKGAIQLKTILREKIEDSDIPISNNPDAAGDLNLEILPLDGLIRLYLLQGTTLNGLIPFGNDITVDFDEDLNLITWRREHNTFIPAQLNPDEEIGVFFHTHVPDKPFISPTDICTFLLYGHDLYGMNTFSVLSTAFDRVFTFNAEEFTISVKTLEEWSASLGQ